MAELKLRDYQIKGVEHLLSRPFGLPHALLADGPGTGKTPMSITAAKEAGCRNGIILCPASIKEQWRRQMIKWGLCTEDEIQVVYGTNALIDSRPWVIVNYALVREKEIRKQLFERNWHCIIEDEAHNLKTHTSQQTNAVFHRTYGIANKCFWKWPLSGSIMPNRPLELYPILKTHFPQVLGKYDNYQDYIGRYCGGGWQAGKGASNIAELTERLQPVMLRRELQDVWAECPPVIENDIWLDVPFESHPEWLGEGFMNEAVQRRIVAEAKIPYVVAYIDDRLSAGTGKLVVFTYHRAVTEGLEKQLAKYAPLKIYGGISPKNRELSLAKFQRDPQHRLIILQIMSAGEGVDGLQDVCAEYILSEPEWCPGREDQAGRRILRLGQTKTVIETRLLAARSFEEVIHYANLRKRKVIDVVLKPNGGSFVMSIEQDLSTIARVASKFEPLIDMLGPALQVAISQQAAAPQAVSAPLALVPAAVPAVTQPAPIAPTAPALVAPPALPAAPPAPSPVPNAAPAAAVPVPAPALAVAPAPAAVPVSPAIAPAAVPVSPAIATAPAAPAPTTAPASSDFGGFGSREAFEKHVMGALMPFGVPAGPQKLQTLCQTFGVSRLGELGNDHIALFVQHLNAAVAA